MTRPGSRRWRGGVGASTIVVIAVFAVGMALALGATRVGTALIARARAETAADAAALAAADALALGGAPTQAFADASVTAADNGARLTDCACEGPRVTVTVEVDVPVLGRVARVRASAEVQDPLVPRP